MSIPGTSQSRRRTYCLLQREAIYKKSTATMTTSKRSVSALSPRMNCVCGRVAQVSLEQQLLRERMQHQPNRLVQIAGPSA